MLQGWVLNGVWAAGCLKGEKHRRPVLQRLRSRRRGGSGGELPETRLRNRSMLLLDMCLRTQALAELENFEQLRS